MHKMILQKTRNSVVAIVMVIAMIFMLAPQTAFAAEAVQAENRTFYFETDSMPDSEELLAGYVDKQFKEAFSEGSLNEEAVYGTTLGDRLSNDVRAKAVYDELKEKIAKVAKGELANTHFTLETSLERLQWTGEDLGCDISKGMTQAAYSAYMEKVGDCIDKALSAVLSDCPYELYWYDTGGGLWWGIPQYEFGTNSEGQNVVKAKSKTFDFKVAVEYRGADEYTADTSKTAATQIAVTNAKRIVDENAAKSDLQKLHAYREAICDAVSYNNEAASNPNTPYGNPWQLIWVFDGNPDTNVVCEGYAKAFQYLCDLSTFDGDVVCYCVAGLMSGGAHMWNVVSYNGKNYLVDVTNCDGGTIGSPDKLFLVGVQGTNENQTHTFTLPVYDYAGVHVTDREISYVYFEHQKDKFCQGYLALSTDPIAETEPAEYGITLSQSGTLTFTAAAVGYGEQQAKEISVRNTGKNATGGLTVALSGTHADKFTLSTASLSSIAADGSASFNVVPQTGLQAGTYTATVTVSGGNEITAQSFNVSFTVRELTYSISLSQSGTHTFTAATVGYSAQTPKVITVTNTGTGATGSLAVALSGTHADKFTLSTASLSSIAADGSASFNVVPQTGLQAGTYTATVTVSGGNEITAQSFNVSFTVKSGSGGSGGGSSGGGGGGGGSTVPSQKPAAQTPVISADKGADVALDSTGTTAKINVKDNSVIISVKVNGEDKGAVEELSDLKNGDKIEVVSMDKKEFTAKIKDTKTTLRSELATTKNGKKGIKIKWNIPEGLRFDGFDIYRSTKKNSGYGKKPIYTTKSANAGYYVNSKSLKKGTKYYYKIRGFVVIDGRKVYTEYSTKASRTFK